MLEQAFQVVSLLSQGASTNWFGIGCPSHCRGADIGIILAAFLFGFLTASAVGLALFLSFCLRAPEPSRSHPVIAPDPPLLRRRLLGYVHERGA